MPNASSIHGPAQEPLKQALIADSPEKVFMTPVEKPSGWTKHQSGLAALIPPSILPRWLRKWNAYAGKRPIAMILWKLNHCSKQQGAASTKCRHSWVSTEW
jgi:hypothetical protein